MYGCLVETELEKTDDNKLARKKNLGKTFKKAEENVAMRRKCVILSRAFVFLVVKKNSSPRCGLLDCNEQTEMHMQTGIRAAYIFMIDR